MLRATDELLAHNRLGDTWDELLAAIGKQPAIELIFVIGTYSTLAMAFETWGLPPSPGAVALPPPHPTTAPTPEGSQS